MKPVELARKTINEYINNKKIIQAPQYLEGVNVEKAGVFVSIKLKDGDLRGCIGTTTSTQKSVVHEIIYNAIAASTQDPRFYPITSEELNNLDMSVDILMQAETAFSREELDPKKYGIIIESKSGRKALLLPNLDGVDTVEYQIAICRMKAAITEKEPIKIKKFEVIRYFD